MANSSIVPKGYKTLGDNTKFLGKVKLSPEQEMVQRLMVKDRDLKNKTDVENKTKPPIQKAKRLSDNISNSIQSQTNLRSITPYIKRAEQIWTTLLLKPNGLDQELLEYNTINSALKNDKLHQLLIQKVKNYFSVDYPFQDKLSQIIKDVMFRTGSYVMLNISYPALDHLINGMAVQGQESFSSSLRTEENKIKAKYFVNNDYSRARNSGWIRKQKVTDINDGLEALFKQRDGGEEFNLLDNSFNFTFTDNFMTIKLGKAAEAITQNRLLNNMGSENINSVIRDVFTKDKGPHKANKNNIGITSKESTEDFFARMYPNRHVNQHETLSIRHAQYYTGYGRGDGITYHVPSEACIPVHQNGEKNNPLGYIFLIDPKSGTFLKTTGDVLYYSSNKNRKEGLDNRPRAGTMNDVITNIKNVAEGADCNIDMDWVVEFVNAQLEKEMMESFLNGDKAVPVTITLTEANKKLYLSRMFKQQGVRSVFVPAEYVTYFALDYNEFGVGKSLVEEAKMIIARLAILDIADTVANLQNAIPKSLLTVDLEEENFNPQELIEDAREKYLQQNPSLLNYIGYAEVPIDRIVDGVKEAMVRIKVNANDNTNIINPGFEESQDQYEGLKPVDDQSKEKALNSIASYFDLKRSWLEDSEQGNDFAIEALADQELLRNITIERSRMFSLFISDFFSKHIYCNEFLMKDLAEVIMENKTLMNKPDQGEDGFAVDNEGKMPSEEIKLKMVLTDFINNLDVTLPIPASIETYNKLVDKIEAANKLADGWKSTAIAEGYLQRVLTQLGLENSENNTDSEFVLGLLDAVIRREAFKKIGIASPFEEIVGDGKAGGVMTFINEVVSQHQNTFYFLERLFKDFSKTNKKMISFGNRYKDGLFSNGGDNENPDNTDDGEQPTTIDENKDGLDVDINVGDDEGKNKEGEQTGEEGNEFDSEKAEQDLNKDSGLDLDSNITF